MIGVRIKNALSIRWGTIKGFDDGTNSVGTTNNATPAAASTAFFAASVEKTKTNENRYISYKDRSNQMKNLFSFVKGIQESVLNI